jgi:hypothetical protein
METQDFFTQSEQKFHEMTTFLQSAEAKVLDLSGLEGFLVQEGRALCRRLLSAHLSERGPGDIGASVVGADGIHRTHKRLRQRTIMTLFGPLTIKRLGYSKPHTSSLFPLDAMLNLPSTKISYTLQKHIVLEIIDDSFHKSCYAIERWTGVKVTNRQAQSIIVKAAEEFTNFYQTRTAIHKPGNAYTFPLLILTSDGKGVFVRTEDLRPATKQKALRKTASDKAKISQCERHFSKRMATVASVYEIDRYIRRPGEIAADFFTRPGAASVTQRARPQPYAKRVWAELKEPSQVVIEAIFQEAMQRDEQQTKEWVVLVDGDLNQIRQFERIAQTLGVSLTIICDIIHVLRYLWKAGNAFQLKEKNATQWVYEKLQDILHGNSRVIATGMKRWATRRRMSKSVREPIDDCARYLMNHAPYMSYHEYLKKGYPIATGVIEGTCRYLVKDRMEITGARWGLTGAEALLKLRAIQTSGDFEDYWKFYEQKQYEKNYKILYKDPHVLQLKKVLNEPSS